MANYFNSNRMAGTQQSNTTTHKTQIQLNVGATARRILVYDVMFGADGAPNATDCQIVYDITRHTSGGTGTVTTSVPLNGADPAAVSSATNNHTAESASITTGTGQVLEASLNQRASQRWVAAPGSELVVAAVTSQGFVFRSLSPTYTSNTLFSVYYSE